MSKPTGSGRRKRATFTVVHPVEHGFTIFDEPRTTKGMQAARDALAAAAASPDEPEVDPIFGDLQKVLPDKSRMEAVLVEYCFRARKEERRYRALVQYAGPNYGVTDAYAPSASLALYRLEVKMRNGRHG